MLVGEEIRSFLSVKIEGKLLSKVMPSVNGADVAYRLDRAIADHRPNYVEKTMAWDGGNEFIQYAALHLPFRSNDEGCARVLTLARFSTSTRDA